MNPKDPRYQHLIGKHARRPLPLENQTPLPIIVVCALCAPEGIARLRDAGLTLHVVTAAVDDRLNDHAFIVPGLGDAGDRQFGPPA